MLAMAARRAHAAASMVRVNNTPPGAASDPRRSRRARIARARDAKRPKTTEPLPVIARPRPLVAYIAPGARRRRLAGSRGEYLDRGVIGEDGPTGQHVTPHRIGQRLEQRRRLADPSGQRRALQLHPVSGEDSALAVQREVVTVFRHEHVGEEPRSGPPALDRARRQLRLMEAIAPSAGQPWANEPLDHEARRDVLQLLGDVLAQALQIGAAVGALLPWGENRLFTGKVFGQGATPR